MFVLTGIAGLLATALALRSGPYRQLSRRYAAGGGTVDRPAAAPAHGIV